MILYFENESQVQFEFEEEALTGAVIEEALAQLQCPFDPEVNVLITDNETIRAYNNEQRKIDRATDVLSFPNLFFEKAGAFPKLDTEDADFLDPENGHVILGDIVISAEKIKEQAIEYGHSEKREFAFLIAHSMLHLSGYDHMTREDAEEMEKKQEAVLEALHITRE